MKFLFSRFLVLFIIFNSLALAAEVPQGLLPLYCKGELEGVNRGKGVEVWVQKNELGELKAFAKWVVHGARDFAKTYTDLAQYGCTFNAETDRLSCTSSVYSPYRVFFYPNRTVALFEEVSLLGNPSLTLNLACSQTP